MIKEILEYAVNKRCSDVHIATGNSPRIRVDGEMMKAEGFDILTKEKAEEMILSIMNDVQKKSYKENLELDFAIELGQNLRFRVNAFYNIYGAAAVFREIASQIKTIEELKIPKIIQDLTKYDKGLILVVGPTGSGKSTTLAALIDHINTNENSHIITIEDPVEFIHKSKKSLVNQREVKTSTLSFANALKGALREDPDVILVGEMRDIETTRLALTAAETGHLVFATLHTSSAAQTINRIVDVFPAEEKSMVRSMISSSIKAVISQRLLKEEGGGRCVAYEIMLANNSICNLIREDKIPQINSIIELNKKCGMCLMKDSVGDLLSRGVISQKTADETLIGN